MWGVAMWSVARFEVHRFRSNFLVSLLLIVW